MRTTEKRVQIKTAGNATGKTGLADMTQIFHSIKTPDTEVAKLDMKAYEHRLAQMNTMIGSF